MRESIYSQTTVLVCVLCFSNQQVTLMLQIRQIHILLGSSLTFDHIHVFCLNSLTC